MLYYIHLTSFPLGVLKGGLGTRLRCADLELSVSVCGDVSKKPESVER